MKKAKRIFTILMALIVWQLLILRSKRQKKHRKQIIKVFRPQTGMEEHIVLITRLRGAISIMVSVHGMRGEEHMN